MLFDKTLKKNAFNNSNVFKQFCGGTIGQCVVKLTN